MLHSLTLPHPDVFRNAIWMHPDDDSIRLRYAAWLDKRCDPLGEFIRVQCELAQGPADETLAWELERREQELLAEFEETWVGEIKDMVDWWVFRRGFVTEVAVSAERFVRHGDRLVELAPIQGLHLSDAALWLGPLARCPALGRVRHLDLSNNSLRDVGVKHLAESPHLAGLQSLNLSSTALGNAGLEALTTSPYLGKLRELYLCDNRIGATGAKALATSPLARQLRSVHLRFNDLSHDTGALLRRNLGERAMW